MITTITCKVVGSILSVIGFVFCSISVIISCKWLILNEWIHGSYSPFGELILFNSLIAYFCTIFCLQLCFWWCSPTLAFFPPVKPNPMFLFWSPSQDLFLPKFFSSIMIFPLWWICSFILIIMICVIRQFCVSGIKCD